MAPPPSTAASCSWSPARISLQPWRAAYAVMAARPPQGSFGTMRRNQLTGPGFASVNLSVFQNIPVTERLKAQFRLEMFNIFNRLNLAPPSCYLFGGFGQRTDTIGDYNGAPGIGPGEPFNMQLALKLIF